jgi:hypothetical protein
MKRNREIEQIIRMLRKEQGRKGEKALQLVMNFSEVAKIRESRK